MALPSRTGNRLYFGPMPENSAFHEVFTEQEPELVFAVVAPVGVNLDSFQGSFTDVLKQFNYDTNPIRLSSLAERLRLRTASSSPRDAREYARIDRLMRAGNDLRKAAKRGDILALHAVAEIADRMARALQRADDPLLLLRVDLHEHLGARSGMPQSLVAHRRKLRACEHRGRIQAYRHGQMPGDVPVVPRHDLHGDATSGQVADAPRRIRLRRIEEQQEAAEDEIGLVLAAIALPRRPAAVTTSSLRATLVS